MSLELEVRHRVGGFALDVCFRSEGRVTALFGRSGSGKTTLINVVAGLIRPDHGRVAVDGAILLDTQRRVWLPAHRRRIGYVFQEPRLFPHLTIKGNLEYGRFFSPRSERRESFGRVVELLGIQPLLHRRAHELSGGERQRVAIGRALLASPRLLLMDEPLASLDEPRKAEILPYIERLRDELGIPIVYVSHSVAEVTRIATTIVVLSDGRVGAMGEAGQVMGRIDLFPLTGRAEAGAIVETVVREQDEDYGLTVLECAAGTLHVPRIDAPVGRRLRVRIRARDVILATSPPIGLSALNVLAGKVAEIGSGAGPMIEIRLDCGGLAILSRITRRSLAALGLEPGRPVYAVIKSVAFDRRTVGTTLPESGEAE